MSTWGHFIDIPGLVVGGDLSAKQYHFVKMASTADTIKAMGASTDTAVGVLMDAPNAAGEAALVASQGIVIVKVGTAITLGAPVGANSTGEAAQSLARLYGQAMEAGAAADLIRIRLTGDVR
jgi:hypothetical protein